MTKYRLDQFRHICALFMSQCYSSVGGQFNKLSHRWFYQYGAWPYFVNSMRSILLYLYIYVYVMRGM